MLHIYHFTPKTSKICLSDTEDVHGKMNLNFSLSLYVYEVRGKFCWVLSIWGGELASLHKPVWQQWQLLGTSNKKSPRLTGPVCRNKTVVIWSFFFISSLLFNADTALPSAFHYDIWKFCETGRELLKFKIWRCQPKAQHYNSNFVPRNSKI